METYSQGYANGYRNQLAFCTDNDLYMAGFDAGSLELKLDIEKHNELLRNIATRHSSTHYNDNDVT